MAQEHSSKQYDLDLETLRSRVLEMGGLVESQILAAINGVAAGDLHMLDRVIEEDHRVNALEVSIDTDCSHLIARRQPTAGDLRMVMAVSKIVTDLERIGDEAAKIARMGKEIYQRDRLLIPRLTDIRKVGGIGITMLRDVLEPPLAAKLKECFFSYRFTAEMKKEFLGDDRFLPVSYKDDWALVRKVAEDSGTPYNRAGFEQERAAEDAAHAKKK